MKKELNKIIKYQVYPFDLMISFNESNKKFVNSLKKYSLDTDDKKMILMDDNPKKTGRTIMLSTNQTVLRLNFFPKTSEDYGMLQHEIFHCAEFLMDRIGIKLSRKSDEAYAYLIGYLTTEIYQIINE